MDDILDLLDEVEMNKDKYSKNTVEPKKKNSEFKFICDGDIRPKKVEEIEHNFKRDKLFFALETFGDIPDDKKDNIVKVALFLIKNGFIFRHTGDSNNDIQNRILEEAGNYIIHTYIPWKKFNANIENPYLFKINKDACMVASAYNSAFNRIPTTVKSILARNVHTVLGKELDRPLTLLLTYTEGGDETVKKDMDFKKIGNVFFFLRLCKAANVPVFNLYNSDAVTRLNDYIKIFKKDK